MARDILCIPASEALVERVFSTARAVCNYKRNQMTPDTIRGIMLVFYRQKIEREQLFEHYSVADIINSTYMDDEEIMFEYHALIDNIQEKMMLQYIPDRSPRQPNTHDRTKRNQDRFNFIQSRRGLYALPRVPRSQLLHRGQRRQVRYPSQANTSTFDLIDPEVEDIERLTPSQDGYDYTLPSLTRPERDNEAQLSQGEVVETIELSQVRNKSRSGRVIQESWRNIDL
jgi:hypothetical protein